MVFLLCLFVFVLTANMYNVFSVMNCKCQQRLGYVWKRISTMWRKKKKDLRFVSEFDLEVSQSEL